MDKYVKRSIVLKTLKIHFSTLYRMAERNEIETIKVGKNMLYNLDKYMRGKNVVKKDRKKICYCRVSSRKQKEDLIRQIEFLKNKYPTYEFITDIGSGINYNREGLKKIIEYIIQGSVEEIVVTYKDRLTRFGFELIEWMLEKYSQGKIIVVNKSEEKTPMEELTKDIITIMNVFVAKVNGLRKYKKEMKETIMSN
jgi:predicted site-specific integrase-resolvase